MPAMLADLRLPVRKAARHARFETGSTGRCEGLQDLVVLGEAALLELGEDRLAVDGDVEDAALAADELRIDAESRLDGGR
jgi:hypothetical protein